LSIFSYWKAIVLSKLGGVLLFFRDRKQYQKEKPDPVSSKRDWKGDSSAVLDNLQIVSRECPGEWCRYRPFPREEWDDGSAQRETGIK
jgi:hypothetical protein